METSTAIECSVCHGRGLVRRGNSSIRCQSCGGGGVVRRAYEIPTFGGASDLRESIFAEQDRQARAARLATLQKAKRLSSQCVPRAEWPEDVLKAQRAHERGKKQTRRTVSMSGHAFAKLKAYCDDRGLSYSAFVQEIVLAKIGGTDAE